MNSIKGTSADQDYITKEEFMTIFEKNKFGQKAGEKIKYEFTENVKDELIIILKNTIVKAPQIKKSDKGLSTIYSADSRVNESENTDMN